MLNPYIDLRNYSKLEFHTSEQTVCNPPIRLAIVTTLKEWTKLVHKWAKKRIISDNYQKIPQLIKPF